MNYWTGAWLKPISGFPNVVPVICATTLLSALGFLGLWKLRSNGNSAAPIYGGCLTIYPIVYYFTTSQPRFYHAITPLLILLGAYFVMECFNRVTGAQRSINCIDGEPLVHGIRPACIIEKLNPNWTRDHRASVHASVDANVPPA